MAERKATEQEQFMKKKLYDVVFTLDPKYLDEKVEQAALVGEFLFYRSNLKGNTDEEGICLLYTSPCSVQVRCSLCAGGCRMEVLPFTIMFLLMR